MYLQVYVYFCVYLFVEKAPVKKFSFYCCHFCSSRSGWISGVDELGVYMLYEQFVAKFVHGPGISRHCFQT